MEAIHSSITASDGTNNIITSQDDILGEQVSTTTIIHQHHLKESPMKAVPRAPHGTSKKTTIIFQLRFTIFQIFIAFSKRRITAYK
eukprot:c35151_g1_i1 orf=133-390(+)